MKMRSLRENSSYIYEVTQTKVSVEEIGLVDVYGLKIYNKDKDLAQVHGEYCCIDDISEDYQKVENLKNLAEELELFPIHLYDVVEDFLA